MKLRKGLINMKTFAVSDLHGCYNLYEQICNFIAPEDKVIFLGDASDRGPEGWKTLKAIYANPQWVYLRGNHEDMLAKAMRYLINETNGYAGMYDYWDNPYTLCLSNGGEETINGWMEDGCDVNWIGRLNNLDLSYVHTNPNGQEIVLTHAGFTDKGKIPIWPEDLMWDRTHFYDSEEKFTTDRIIVHGHTPIPHLYDRLKRYGQEVEETYPLWYCGNHKVCLDCGSFATKKTVLLDLDTFKSYEFAMEENDEKTIDD